VTNSHKGTIKARIFHQLSYTLLLKKECVHGNSQFRKWEDINEVIISDYFRNLDIMGLNFTVKLKRYK